MNSVRALSLLPRIVPACFRILYGLCKNQVPVQISATCMRMEWTNEPATWRQVKSLKELGHTTGHRMTKIEAADLIRNLGGKPESTGASMIGVENRPQIGPYQLRLKVEKAKGAIADAGGNKTEKLDHELAAVIAQRQEFWIDTCLGAGKSLVASTEIHELYQKHGCRFEAPSRADVQHIIDALDQAVPQWDRAHPELFYQTLELNFPILVRRPGGL